VNQAGRGQPGRPVTPAPPARRSNIEIALDLADYWRLKCVSLLEENVRLREDNQYARGLRRVA